uniref:Tight junction protein 2a (zona occludens 2) n=1 Tax=Cyprinus carpio TaxID=7962 RepID=A0A8C2DLL0_CYPCA
MHSVVENPNEESGEGSIVVSDVLQGGPADGLLFENDRVIQVNNVPMDGVQHAFAVQTLRKCGKVAKITIKRSRKIPVSVIKRAASPDDRVFSGDYNDDYDHDRRSYPDRDASYADERDRDYDRSRGRSMDRGLSPDRQYRRDGSRGRMLDHERSPDRRYRSDHNLDRDHSPDRRYRSDRTLDRNYSPDRRYRSEHNLDRSHSPDTRYRPEPAPGYSRENLASDHERKRFDLRQDESMRGSSRDRLDRSPSPPPPQQHEPLEKPLSVTLLKNRPNDEYGLRLGSQLFIKEMTSTGLASKEGKLQEGDVILKINGTATENLSLSDAGKLIEKSRGKLQLVVQRDRSQVLIRIPPMADSDSEIDDISEIESYRSYSPQEDRRSHHSDLSSHSSNERLHDKTRDEPPKRLAKMGAMPTPFRAAPVELPPPPVEKEEPRSESPAPVVNAAPKSVPVKAKPLPKVPLRPSLEDQEIYGPNTVMVRFQKGESVGLRLAGGNDVGIFIAGVQEDSPADIEGLRTGDQIVKVNNMDFRGMVREDAVLLKDAIREQQEKAVWVCESKLDGSEEDLDLHDDRMSYLSAMSADYLSMDSRLTSDYEDTADEGGAYTDNELDESTDEPQPMSAISRSSEPVSEERPIPVPHERLKKPASKEVQRDPSPPPSFVPAPPKVRAASRPADSRSFDSRSSSTVSSDAPVSSKPLPPPVAQKPSFTSRTGPKIEITETFFFFFFFFVFFYKLSFFFSVPHKPKPNQNRPQPIGSSSNSESHSSSKAPYSESRSHHRAKEDDDEEENRRQRADQTRRGYYNPQKYSDTEL